ncbi:MAG TPA: hypothetical protein VMR14_17240 [Streptosporangiaceae bacterium]|jgi:hypothetical protein|nr:hypothetical protein [Streptosporangiaceae bacterium]
MKLGRQRPDDQAARPRVGVGRVLGSAALAGRRYWWRILSVAVIVSIITSFAEVIVDDFVDESNLPLALLAHFSALGLSLLGAVLLWGFICRLVGSSMDLDLDLDLGRGQEDASLGRVLRTLPWGRLVAADLLVSLIVIVGLLALVIPGLAALTFLAVVGPVIETERLKVRSALRRSAHLVRGHFWVVALLVTLPVALESELASVAPHLANWQAVLEVFAIRGIAEGIAEAAIGLVVVNLCFRLIALDRERSARPASLYPGHRPGFRVLGSTRDHSSRRHGFL